MRTGSHTRVRRSKIQSARAREGRRFVEGLESRQLFSAAGITVSPSIVVLPSSVSAAASATTTYVNPSGYTPAQIRAAYGFNQVAFSTSAGTVTGDGTGQTIAIVDAYNDPKIAADLATFDSRELSSSTPVSSFLSVVNQNGGASLPATNAGWAGEISLDVEWAHAVAPGAKILLVEAGSASLNDLLAGVNYARHAAGVSVVSMSWGAGEFSSESAYDSYFTTPAGHQGVTFVAASGDEGPFYGAEWPSASPNVMSVGGTSLSLQDANGTYGTESAWAGSTGGTSRVESIPSYQAGLPASDTRSTSFGRFGTTTTSHRSAPDVAYDADPNTGFAVYDSVLYDGYSGWEVVGGTSAGAPQWAALVSIADQGRTLAGKATLDGTSQTLPALYSLYANPGTTGYATYSADFHDVTGGVYYNPATSGYDQSTGLGSPRAVQTVSALLNAASSGASTTTTTTTVASAATTGKRNTTAPRPDFPSQGPDSTLTQYALSAEATAARAEVNSASSALAAGAVADPFIAAGPSAAAVKADVFRAGLVGGLAATGSPRNISFGGQVGGSDAVVIGATAGDGALAVSGAAMRAAASALVGVTESTLLPGLSPLLSGATSFRMAEPIASGVGNTLLSLAPALWVGQDDGGAGWEILAGASLGVALAGYWYTTASERGDDRRARADVGQSPAARRVPGGWELVPLELLEAR